MVKAFVYGTKDSGFDSLYGLGLGGKTNTRISKRSKEYLPRGGTALLSGRSRVRIPLRVTNTNVFFIR